MGGRVEVQSLTLIVSDQLSRPVSYAIDELTRFCAASPGIEVKRRNDWAADGGTVVLVGREQAQLHGASLCAHLDWDQLGGEGFILRAGLMDGVSVFVAAGATDAGTRQAIYTLMCRLDVTSSPPVLSADLDLREIPSFDLRGMYAHQHWAYNHPYALRTWSVEEWKQYVDILSLMRVNLFQIWSMAGILPMPLSAEDEAFLRRYPPVIEHARENHGMEVWIGECANNLCDEQDVLPITQRYYFDVESLKDPSDPEQMAQLREARSEFYRICDNADGYWILDSDPGKWKGSPASEFADICMMNRELIDELTIKGKQAKLVYWMWLGWGTGSREENWRDVASDLKRRSPEPWLMTVAWDGHWQVADEVGLCDRLIYYPYGPIEPEPSMPFTTVVPQVVVDVLNVSDRVGQIRGAMGNAQTPICQLPNIYYFTRAIWNMNLRDADREQAVAELARLIYPERASLVTQCWMSLGSSEAPDAARLADELEMLCETNRLGRPGPIGVKLFPDVGQVARDLVVQLRIHGIAMEFCKMAGDPDVDQNSLLEQLKRYCVTSLAWRRQNGFETYGTNGYNFFPVREAAHKHWWRGDHLDTEVYAALEQAMRSGYDAWEAELILFPLNH